MKETIGEKLSRIFHGKSDRANARENQNEDFQSGFAFGRDFNGDRMKAITSEWIKRGKPHSREEGFAEWKRGMFAATFQKL